MPTLTPVEAYAAARTAGFPPDTARQMVAIAQRESSLNTGVVGTISPKETSYGLWQINWKDAGIQNLLRSNGITDPTQLQDPVTNARAAYLLWGGNDANLNTAWYINKTGSQYGYAEKYNANLAKLPAAADLELAANGGGKLVGAGAGAGVGVPGSTVTLTSSNGYDYMPGAGAGGDGNGNGNGGSGGGFGLDLSAFGFNTDPTAAGEVVGLSTTGWVMVAAAGLVLWWFIGRRD